MIIIKDVLINDEIVTEDFHCNLTACKGACCWEGDFGAPLEREELHILKEIYDSIKPFLTDKGQAAIEKQGLFVFYDEAKEYGTPLINNSACAYLTIDELGIAKCGIEKAFEAGKTAFRKPISCHLYPIRISQKRQAGFQHLEYEKWEICSAACDLGAKKRMPVFRFVKDALIRKFGPDFYEELEASAEFYKD